MGKRLIYFLCAMAVVLVLLVAFGIGQPFLWQLINKTPPPTTMPLTGLLTIVIIILALGIAAFGGGTYYILSRRIQEEATRAAKKEYLETVVRLRSHVCELWGRLYEGLQNTIVEKELSPFADRAVFYGELAALTAQRENVAINKSLLLQANNSYAMALALRGDPGTAKTAAELVKYIQRLTESYPPEEKATYKETNAFVLWRLPRNKKDLTRAQTLLEEAMQVVDEAVKQRWQNRRQRFPKGKIK